MKKIFAKLIVVRNQERAFTMPVIMALLFILSIVGFATVEAIYSNITLVANQERSQRALNISEAGINYYLWHLSHNGGDFKDGQTTPAVPDPTLGYGPYVHDYKDTTSKITGTYTIWIKPTASSSAVSVRSIGKVAGSSQIRTIVATVGTPSYASYGVISDSEIWFGANETADGPVHSNQGVRMDGPSNSDVSSAKTTYTPSFSFGGDGAAHPGVWCNTSVTTPVNCNTRSKANWLYPKSSVDFNQLTGDLCSIKKVAFLNDPTTAALASGSNPCNNVPTTRTAAYVPQASNTGSYSKTTGYLISLNSNDTYDLSKVTAENDQATSYSAALTTTVLATGVAIASNRVIFVEDNVWLRTNGNYNNRVTIGTGRLAQAVNTPDVTFVDNVKYQDKDGSDVIGAIAQGSVLIAPYAAPATGAFTLEIDAAAIAQNGDAQWYLKYKSDNSKCTKGYVSSNQQLLYYGSVAMRQVWTWSWIGSCSPNAVFANGTYNSGFVYNTTQFDYNLLYSPPPYFPRTSTYNVLDWREIITTP